MSNRKRASNEAAKQPATPRGFTHIQSKKNIHEYVLTANGLRVLHVSLPGSPTITTNIVYHVGSKDEAYGETGLAHMLEHMLFKPTHTKGLAWKKLEDKGAKLNATTWLDRTLYYFNLPTEYLDDMLMVEADRMRNVTLTDAEFIPERANVLSEYEMNNSKPEEALGWVVMSSAFQSHGYKHDTIGFRSDIESFTPEKLKQFYDRYYWPNNATLIVVGDIDAQTVLKSVEKHFATIPGNFDANTRPHATEPTQEGVRRVELIRNTPVRSLTIAFKAPAFTSREWGALMLALNYLTLGETSVLHKKLVDSNLATSVEAHVYPTHHAFLAFFTVSATEKASYEKIEQIIFDAIKILEQKPLAAGELSLLKTYDHAQELMSRDGSFSIAAQLGEFVSTGSWERYYDGLDELMSLTPKEVQHAASTYLTKNQATIGTIVKQQ